MAQNNIVIKTDNCDLCGTCVAVCPADAIVLYRDRIQVLHDQCTGCGRCVAVCPLAVPVQGGAP